MTTAHEVPVAELRNTLGDHVARTAYTGERVVITRRGKPAAALISTDDLARLEALEMAEDVADFDKAIAEDDGGRIALVDLDEHLDKD
ncbi:type II toxin-antitoxin system Phd/YefM family antitoxin [Mycobacteroides abscessus]|nr:type II toxin-antitoxin system Phd/YefM family antitoxin [Mycobacteroides abscessus]MDM2408483.1 type II toxin-antitoxin system Phd/YefM family antitoxin [Mycobacteroides abscessus]